MSHHVQLSRAESVGVAPAPGEVPSVARPPYRWSFVSPSALLLALVTLALPWVEIRCSSGGPRVERRTGAQMLVNRATIIDERSGEERSEFLLKVPLSMSIIWLWFFAVVAAAGLGFFPRHLVPALLHLVLSCSCVGTFVMLVLCVEFENLFYRVRFLPAVYLAFLACLIAAVASVVTMAKQHGGRQLQNADP